VIFGAVYMLWMFQRVMFGEITHEENKSLKDLNLREMIVLAPLVLAIFVMGIFPNTFFSAMAPAVDRFLERSGAVAVAGAIPVESSQGDGSEVRPVSTNPQEVEDSAAEKARSEVVGGAGQQ